MKTSLLSRTFGKLFALLFALVFASSAHAQIASWNFTGQSNSVTAPASFANANLSAAPELSRGAGAAASTGANSFRTTGFQNNGIATTNTDYFQTSFTATVGYKVSVTSISAYLAGTTSFSASPGVSNQFAYSTNGTDFVLIGEQTLRVGNGSIGPVDTSAVAELQNVPAGTTVTLRYYASGQTTTGGWGFNSPNSTTDGLLISGSVTSDSPNAPVVTSELTASTVAFTPFSYQITASNNPDSFDATGLPAGLTVDTATGVISGTPTVVGQFSIPISASNSFGTGGATLSLTISQNPGAPVITSALTATTAVDTPFSYQIEASNSPVSYAASNLPTGLSVDTATGLISGTPTAAGTRNVTISATNVLGTDSKTLSITVTAPPTITSSLTGNAIYLGSAYSYQITASGSPAPTSYGATGLPDGVTIDTASGLISGTPTAAGNSTIEISATNTIGTATGTFTLMVLDQAAQNAIPLKVVVNKYANGSATTSVTVDKVQLLVVGSGTPGSTVDMRGMIIKDFSGDMVNDAGGKYFFSNDALWSAIPAGTLITLSAGATETQDVDPSDFYVAVNLGDATYFTSGGGSFNIGTIDMVMIKAAGTGVNGVAGGIHALAGGTAGAQFTAFLGAKLIATGTSAGGFGVIANNSTPALSDYGTSGFPAATDATGAVANDALDFASWNNAANQIYIQGLRGSVPPNPYNTWASGFGLEPAVTEGPTAGAPTADPDGDTFNNAQEYAFGTNPTQGTPSLLTTETSGGDLIVQWLQRGDVTYTPQSTANLATTLFADDFSVNVVNGPAEPAPPAGYIRRQFTVPASGQKFYRVSAITSP